MLRYLVTLWLLLSASAAAVKIPQEDIYAAEGMQLLYEKRTFQIVSSTGETHSIPINSFRELKGIPEEQIVNLLCSGNMWFKIIELYQSLEKTEYGLRASFRLRGGRPITSKNVDRYKTTLPPSKHLDDIIPRLIAIDPSDVRCEHEDVHVDLFGDCFRVHTPQGKTYNIPKSTISVLNRFSSKQLGEILAEHFYKLDITATYDGREIKYTINARFSPPPKPGDMSSRASFREARMAGRSASYATAETKEDSVRVSMPDRSTHTSPPKVFLSPSEWDGLIEELSLGEATFQVAKNEYIKVNSRIAGEFYMQVADLHLIQVARAEGLAHVDFEVVTLAPLAGKVVVSVGKAALTRLAARKAAKEIAAKTTLNPQNVATHQRYLKEIRADDIQSRVESLIHQKGTVLYGPGEVWDIKRVVKKYGGTPAE